ncbi:hypothetical protein K470DRAFT_267359 [Piedraia hortae CBS 480.64]|uniref:STEEP1 domain-containing protein n=1 Tax=Piedraia hortae CBS 480.64 TaxID=1314780 RepID=A0A6A7CBK8_9PEZI|nr:hypothetical protein K470DRAFT_267359 [Piedraia hortae CBS 480.64]
MHATLHCQCLQLACAVTDPLDALKTRARDGAHIAVQHHLYPSVKVAETPLMLRLDDGFEKRYLATCSRCRATFGYYLDKEQQPTGGTGRNGEILYVLPGVVPTEALSSAASQ